MKSYAAILCCSLLVFLAGCMEKNAPVVQGNTVIGSGVGLEGYAFKIPAGYRIYDRNSFTESSKLGDSLYRKATDFQSGRVTAEPVILVSDEVALAFIPDEYSSLSGYARVSDMHSQMVTVNFSHLDEKKQLEVLERLVGDINVFGDSFEDIRTYSRMVDGVPLGYWDALAKAGNGAPFPMFFVERLGLTNEVYKVMGIGLPITMDEGIRDAEKLLLSLKLEDVPQPVAETVAE